MNPDKLARLRSRAVSYFLDPSGLTTRKDLLSAIRAVKAADVRAFPAVGSEPIRRLMNRGPAILSEDDYEDHVLLSDMARAAARAIDGLTPRPLSRLVAEGRQWEIGAVAFAAMEIARLVEERSARLPARWVDPRTRDRTGSLVDRIVRLSLFLNETDDSGVHQVDLAMKKMHRSLRLLVPSTAPDQGRPPASYNEGFDDDWLIDVEPDVRLSAVDDLRSTARLLDGAAMSIMPCTTPQRDDGVTAPIGACDGVPEEAETVSQNDARDAWIYQRAVRGDPAKDIIAELKAKARQKRWGVISTWPGLKEAANRYAARKRLSPIPARQIRFRRKNAGKRRSGE